MRFTKLIASVVFLSLSSGLWAYAEDYQVRDVLIAGNQRVDTAAIKQQLGKIQGAISAADITSDIKNLYRTGFFEQVTAAIVPAPSGAAAGNYLRYTVSEKPVVRRVFVKGNKEISEKDLKDVFSFDARRFMDAARVQALIKKAVALYQNKGYHDASIDYTVAQAGDNQVDITFNVKEGQRYKIREIDIRGLKTVDESDLLGAMQTKRYKWWSSWLMGTGRLNQDMLENDRGLMRQYLLDRGLVDAAISEPSIETKEDGFYVSFDVEEGRIYSFGDISASGDLINSSRSETLEGIKAKQGKTFSAATLREDAFHISEKFTDTGYAFANVVPNTSVDRESAKVDLDFQTNKGNLVRVNRIDIRGNDKTYDHVIRRELKIDEQDIYSGRRVRRSQELLQRLGYFQEVNITQDPVGDDKVNLNVNVKEGSTGTFSAGAGYSTSDGAIFNTRISENNLFGTGRRIVFDMDIGTLRDSYILSVDDPRLLDSYVSGGIDLMRTDRIYRDFDRKLQGGALSFGYPLEELLGSWAEDVATGLKYEYLDINITNVDPNSAAQLVIESQGRSTASGITPQIVRNTINNPLNPTKGSRQELSIEVTGLGGDADFYLLEARNTLYTPVFDPETSKLIFSWRFTLGYGESNNDEPFPLYRRFFPGGINSVRGYRTRSLGPKDANDHAYGGSKELINNFDLIFPLVSSAGLNFVTFYDAGQAFDDDEPIEISELRQAYGVGVRWASPVGPIRLEFGFPIDRRGDEDSMVTMFSFGAPL